MRRHLLIVAALAAAFTGTAGAASFPAVKSNPADRLASLAIESFSYDRATHCVKKPASGAVALQQWLERNARGSSWGIVRCEMWGKRSASLHAEGRALDWHLDVSRPADRREAQRLIGLLLAPDRLGRPAALARRMGVQEIIWDCRAWFGGEPRLQRYSACKGKVDRTTAHRDHTHFGLTRRGAKKLTSFWTRKPPPDEHADAGLTLDEAPDEPFDDLEEEAVWQEDELEAEDLGR